MTNIQTGTEIGGRSQLQKWEKEAQRLLVLMKNLQGDEERPVVAPGIDALDGDDGPDVAKRIDQAYTEQAKKLDQARKSNK